MAQVANTGHEIVLQFYETIPGVPEPPDGKIQSAKTRLRATITISKEHAANVGNLLLQQMQVDMSAGAKK